ncbi:MAG: RidA family protein [Candidatus Caenarcaniphilales bacterium]|jgi:enamine deaminase RidA (YjgF/YER057c/UK114 family)|nr:RidA family protein [Candidatus Caenarcaniphilales bacterium]
MTVEEKLKKLNITLPAAPNPVANYCSYVVNNNIVYISGQVSKDGDKLITGKLGLDMDQNTAIEAARVCGLNLLAQLKSACGGDLEKVKQCIKLTVFINCGPEYKDLPPISNGVSDLMVEVLGDIGRHARSTIGMASLPFGAAVEVEGTFEICS